MPRKKRQVDTTDAMINYGEGLRQYTGLSLEDQLETEAVREYGVAMAKRKARRENPREDA